MKRSILFIAFALLIFSSCSKLGEIELMNVELKSFKLLNTTSANIEVEYTINNPSNKRIILDNVDAYLKKSGANFAKISLIDADTVASKRISVNRLSLKLDLLDPLSLFSMGLNLSKWQYTDFTVDARALVKSPTGWKKRIKLKDVEIEDLIKKL